MRKLYLIRHGETTGNLEKRYIGSRTDASLSAEGVEKLIERSKLIDFYPEAIYASPMKRAMETAKLLFKDRDFKTEDRLKEIDFGDFEGKNYLELSSNPDYQRWIDSGGETTFPNGEAKADFIKRSYEGFIDILKKDASNSIAIVCHGGNISSIMSVLTGKGFFDFQVGCAEGFELEIEEADGEIDEISYHRLFGRSDS